jgi:hypothetical protein
MGALTTKRNILLGVAAITGTALLGLSAIKYFEALNTGTKLGWQYATGEVSMKASFEITSKEAIGDDIKLCDPHQCWTLQKANIGRVFESIPNDRPVVISGGITRLDTWTGQKIVKAPIIRVDGETIYGPPAF